ncbi:DMT family transporter [Marinobacterium jannaschii]|uniref:DMT family transporter n=1 Tax=Marinobacterium jannaschii TaxID=64970 RepID=UPI0004877394|nr:DMT family transporter [Marinobacterium jannaschii]
MESRWLPVFSLFTAMLLWSSSFIALKLAFQYYDPMFVVFGRMAVASLCFMFVIRRIAKFEYRAGDWKYLALMVVSEPCLYFIFEAMALQNTTAMEAGMITSLLPLLVAVGAFFLLKERLHGRAWLGFLIAVCGAIWLSVSGEQSESAPNPLLGNFLEFCAMICATGYTLCLKHLSQRYSSWFLTALQAFAGSVFFLPLVYAWDGGMPTTFEMPAVLAILYLGTLINIGAYGMYNLGVSKISASQASAFVNLIPVFTLILAYVVLRETLNAEQMMAAGLVIGGVILSQWQPRNPEPELVGAA